MVGGRRKGSEGLGKGPLFFIEEIRKGLKIILSKQNWKDYLSRLKKEIMALTEFELSERLKMAKLATRWVEDSRNVGVKSVTIF